MGKLQTSDSEDNNMYKKTFVIVYDKNIILERRLIRMSKSPRLVGVQRLRNLLNHRKRRDLRQLIIHQYNWNKRKCLPIPEEIVCEHPPAIPLTENIQYRESTQASLSEGSKVGKIRVKPDSMLKYKVNMNEQSDNEEFNVEEEQYTQAQYLDFLENGEEENEPDENDQSDNENSVVEVHEIPLDEEYEELFNEYNMNEENDEEENKPGENNQLYYEVVNDVEMSLEEEEVFYDDENDEEEDELREIDPSSDRDGDSTIDG